MLKRYADIKKIWFIILNYNNYNDTLACIDSIHANGDVRYVIVIVDNNSSDGSGERLKNKFPDDVCLLLTKNGGYAAGNNVGIRYALEYGAQYICVLNNDVVIPADFVDRALRSLEKNANLDIISPLICEYSQPEVVQSAGATVDLSTGKEVFLHHGECANAVDVGGDEPDYLGGACFIVRRKVFSRIGLLPEFYFLFCEETDWFFSAQKRGVSFACDAEIRVYHKGSASIGQVRGLSRYYLTRNKVIFERRKANTCQLVKFILYSACRWMYHLIRNKKSIFPLKAFYDGWRYHLPKEGIERKEK